MEIIQGSRRLRGPGRFLGLAVLSLCSISRRRATCAACARTPSSWSRATRAPSDPGDERRPPAIGRSTEAEPRGGRATRLRRDAPTDAEAFRRAELARQAAERRQRFEQRRAARAVAPARTLRGSPPTAVIDRSARSCCWRGIGFGATRLLGGDERRARGRRRRKARLPARPDQGRGAQRDRRGGLAGDLGEPS